MSTLVPTMADVAREAGVSIVTVDRVLNQRAPVRPSTERKVLDAARRLNFALGKVQALAATSPAPQASTAPPQRLAFFLLRSESVFYQEMANALTTATKANSAVSVADIYYFEDLNSQERADLLLDKGKAYDAIALVSVDHPAINQAVDRLGESGVRSYALITDLTATQCAGYVGLDNRKAGRTAAWSIARLNKRPGKIGLLLGDHRFLCQELCEISFRSYFREHAGDFRILETRLTHEDITQAKRVTSELLAEHSDLVGLYVSCGGVEGVLQALRESGRAGQIVVVGHDLTDCTRQGLVDGTVDVMISMRREEVAKALMDLMGQATPLSPEVTGSGAATSVVLPFDLTTAENI